MKKPLSTTTNKRQSNFELLRIVAMLMIVCHHFSFHGGFAFTNTEINISRIWVNLLSMGGKIGVDIYVLISGFFLINDKEIFFNFKRLLKLWFQIAFYSIAITMLFTLCRGDSLGIQTAIKMLLPITFSQWWFASTYFVLYLVHPFINRFLLNLDKSTYQKFLVLCITCWCIIPTFTTSAYQGNALIWFITLYSVAAYIRLYDLNPKAKGKHYVVLWLAFSVLTYLSSIVFDALGKRYEVFSIHDCYFFGQEKLSILLVSLCLFMAFKNMTIKDNKLINLVASATFGVYLIHDNNLIRSFLWIDVFKNALWQTSPYLIPYSIIVILLVFVVCTIIDLLRKYILEKPILKVIDKSADKIILPFLKIINYAKSIAFGREES